MSDQGMMSNHDRLVYMANQIARNLAAQGHDAAVRMMTDHLVKYWDPRMKAQIVEMAADGADLSPIALAAVNRLNDYISADPHGVPVAFNAVDERSLRSDAGWGRRGPGV